jgi:hypothetical protein
MIEAVIWDFGGVLSSSAFGVFAFNQLFVAESLALGAEIRGKDVLPLLSGKNSQDPKEEKR